MTKTSLYDLSELSAISMGDDSFLIQMVRIFTEQTPGIVDEILARHAAGDLPTMGNLAHQIKQSIYSMGIEDLKESILVIVNAGRTGEVTDDLTLHLTKLKQTTDEVVRDLNRRFEL